MFTPHKVVCQPLHHSSPPCSPMTLSTLLLLPLSSVLLQRRQQHATLLENPWFSTLQCLQPCQLPTSPGSQRLLSRTTPLGATMMLTPLRQGLPCLLALLLVSLLPCLRCCRFFCDAFADSNMNLAPHPCALRAPCMYLSPLLLNACWNLHPMTDCAFSYSTASCALLLGPILLQILPLCFQFFISCVCAAQQSDTVP